MNVLQRNPFGNGPTYELTSQVAASGLAFARNDGASDEYRTALWGWSVSGRVTALGTEAPRAFVRDVATGTGAFAGTPLDPDDPADPGSSWVKFISGTVNARYEEHLVPDVVGQVFQVHRWYHRPMIINHPNIGIYGGSGFACNGSLTIQYSTIRVP